MSRDELAIALGQRSIGTGIHYLCLAEHPFYQEKFGWRPADYPAATRIGRQTISLPLSGGLSPDDVLRVITAVRDIAREAGVHPS